jgi:hypothetical protein
MVAHCGTSPQIATNAGLLMSAIETFDGPENSAGAKIIPVEQSSPDESSC